MADINKKDFYSSFSAITEEVIDHNLTTCLLQLLVSYQTKNWHVSEQSKDFGIYAVAQPEPPRQTKELCKRLSRITPAFRLQLTPIRQMSEFYPLLRLLCTCAKFFKTSMCKLLVLYWRKVTFCFRNISEMLGSKPSLSQIRQPCSKIRSGVTCSRPASHRQSQGRSSD